MNGIFGNVLLVGLASIITATVGSAAFDYGHDTLRGNQRPLAWTVPTASVPYAASSPWNTPITNSTPDPNSDQMITTLSWSSTGGKIYSDTTRYTYPVFWADASTPRYDVRCIRYKCTIVADGQITKLDTLIGVPIPNGARPAGGSDAQMIIIDTQTGHEYGFWRVFQTGSGGWQASNGYRYHIGYDAVTPGLNARGAGVPYMAGLIRPWEIRAGAINHAIAFAYQMTAAGRCVWPATKTDGTYSYPFAIPEGARIQLDPALTNADFDAMGLSRAGKIVARALQLYGMILVDTGGSPKIMAEDLVDNQLSGLSRDNPDLQYPKDVIAAIPYSEFRVLALPTAYYSSSYSPNLGSCVK